YERRLQLTHELKRQLERIQWLVETLLKMSKIDAGTALFRKEQVPLKELLNEATEPFLITLELKGVDLELSAGEGYLECDRSWTGEALANLLKNCMEHTPAGGHIKVSCEDTALSTNITIEDSGEGFSEADLPYVFERFYKGSNSSPGSIGIGLAFSRMIISAQNGTITAENSREGGARFRIKFYKSIV
ncbi:MAG: HAMP domain-containing histidine kinase, partial [Lachnospiraceae bacterium]|nr:HAMP domain-containing histidine kinase [Lachnospiraceae bacterium]